MLTFSEFVELTSFSLRRLGLASCGHLQLSSAFSRPRLCLYSAARRRF